MTPAAPLASRLATAIAAGGPMTVAAYMQACLADASQGYYATREPFGAAGDFMTAPEISQMFGEIVGAWTVAAWEAAGAPGRFALVELGPGRGTLMRDLLRIARLRPAFLAAAELHLVETSRRLREVQRTTMADAGMEPVWHDAVETLPDLPRIVLANEFFDALPIRQFVFQAGSWQERMVGLDDKGRLVFGLRQAADPTLPLHAPEQAVLELSPSATAIMACLAEALVRHGGALLIIDYGHAEPGFGDTFQAVKSHRAVDPLAFPGTADLTAHVDFAALSTAAKAAGAVPTAIVGQGAFLARLGLHARAARLAEGKDAAVRDAIAASVARLAATGGMGELFKVMAVTRPGMVLAGFD